MPEGLEDHDNSHLENLDAKPDLEFPDLVSSDEPNPADLWDTLGKGEIKLEQKGLRSDSDSCEDIDIQINVLSLPYTLTQKLEECSGIPGDDENLSSSFGAFKISEKSCVNECQE